MNTKTDFLALCRQRIAEGTLTIERFHKEATAALMPKTDIANYITLLFKDETMQANTETNPIAAALADVQATVTDNHYESQGLAKAFDFACSRSVTAYLKAKDSALKAKGAYMADAVQNAKDKRAEAIAWLAMSSAEWDMTTCITEYCGHGREWAANGKAVAQYAEANQIDTQTAADLLGRSMAVAQDYAQSTRGMKFAKYMDWINAMFNEINDDGAKYPENIEEVVLNAYQFAAKYNQPAEGILISDWAKKELDYDLPSWKDTLIASLPSKEDAAASRTRMATRAAALAQQEAEAEDEARRIYGDF
jgi:Tfp pilus assembly major pilin PilA